MGSAPETHPEVSFRRNAACRYKHGHTQDHPLTWNVFYEMNHREPPLSPADNSGTRLGLLLGLLLAWASTGIQAQTRSYSIAFIVQHTDAIPYLPAVGAPPLRFQEAALPLHPAPSAPAQTSTPPPAAPIAEAPASTSAESTPEPVATTEPATPADSAPVRSAETETSPEPAKTPAPILPDDARPPIRAEDFLPYFQIPGSARTPADVTLLVPVPKAPPTPGTLPPSSATYQQTP